MTNEKHFPKTISQWEFDYGFLQIYRQLLSLATYLRVHSNSKEVPYFSWENTYPNLRTTCHIKLKLFLWTKLLENSLLAKYLLSLAATLLFSYYLLFTLLQKQPSEVFSKKKVFLKISQISQESTCIGVSFQ